MEAKREDHFNSAEKLARARKYKQKSSKLKSNWNAKNPHPNERKFSNLYFEISPNNNIYQNSAKRFGWNESDHARTNQVSQFRMTE